MKTQYRQRLLKQRDSLSYEFVSDAERKIIDNFMSSKLSFIPSSKSIMLYASFRNEAATFGLMERLCDKGIKVVLPKTYSAEIIPFEYKGKDSLVKDSLGIMTPDESLCPKAVLSDIHTVIIPGVVFDKKGGRIGFGKGCYDRFLPQIPEAIKIGLCYDFQIIPSVPVTELDIPMDYLLTEEGIIRCNI